MNRKRAEKVSKALADATRLSILEAICARKEMICGDIARLEGVTPATVSLHLKVLANAGLIECQRKGPFVHSRAAGRTIDQYMQFLARVTQHTQSRWQINSEKRKRSSGSESRIVRAATVSGIIPCDRPSVFALVSTTGSRSSNETLSLGKKLQPPTFHDSWHTFRFLSNCIINVIAHP